MRIATSILIGLSLLCTSLAFGESNPQQEKMKTCNADAKTQNLSGDARKDFMKTCLSGDKKEMTAQQQRMSTCSKEAAAQNMTGASRKTFMSACLKGK